MPWQDRLNLGGKGSFRDVEFFVDSTESTIGRRKIVHQFPGRTEPRVVDDGGLPREFTLRCFVVGEDYDLDRDDLREEFTTPGPGLLVHPYWGEFEVEVTGPVRIREVGKEGGIARFDLSMIEVGLEPLTFAVPDLGPAVEIAADEAIEATEESFEEDYSVLDAISAVVQTAINAVQSVASNIRAARGKINAALGVIDDIGAAIDAVADAATSLAQTAAALASAVTGLVGKVMSAVDQIGDALSDIASIFTGESPDFKAEKVLDAVRSLSDPALDEVLDTDSGQTAIEQANQAAIATLQKRASVIEGARALAAINFESRDFVLSARDEMEDFFDELILDAEDNVWAALTDLRDVFSRRMNEIAQELPDITEHTPLAVIPALATAYNVHRDSKRDSEIIARNGIKNPNFVPAGDPLKVLVE